MLHEVTPVRHALLLGKQTAFVVHATQAPLLHTLSVPHCVPSDAEEPVSVQTMPPSLQEIVPLWHALVDGEHVTPLVQAVQVPSSQ